MKWINKSQENGKKDLESILEKITKDIGINTESGVRNAKGPSSKELGSVKKE